MISLIVLCPSAAAASAAQKAESGEAAVRTLAAFVSVAVRGLVREAVLVGPPQIGLAYIADHAGCACIEAKSETEGLTGALALGRAPHLLIIRAGFVPDTGFAERVEDILRFGKAETQGWLIRGEPGRPIEKILPHLAQPAALLAPRRLCTDVRTPTFAALAKLTHAPFARQIRLRRVI